MANLGRHAPFAKMAGTVIRPHQRSPGLAFCKRAPSTQGRTSMPVRYVTCLLDGSAAGQVFKPLSDRSFFLESGVSLRSGADV